MIKYQKQLLNTGLESLSAASEKVVQKAGEFFGKKNSDPITNSHDVIVAKQ